MPDKLIKRYLFASDFDQTLSFNDSGYVLSELLGIPAEEFERKARGMAHLNLVQQGAELAYLLLHDPQFRGCRREHLHQVGKRIPLKENIELLHRILESGIEGYHFDFVVLSAAPVEIVKAALEGIVPPATSTERNFSTTARARSNALCAPPRATARSPASTGCRRNCRSDPTT